MRNITIKLALCGLLAGCAAQNAHSVYQDAEQLVKEAMKKAGPNDPLASQAFDVLGHGKMQMVDANYDAAIRDFREAMRLSRGVLAAQVQPNSSAATNVPEGAEPQIIEEISKANIQPVVPSKPSASSAGLLEAGDGKKSLPKEALAKYLAGKKAPPAPPPAVAAVPVPPKEVMPTEEPQKSPEPERAAAAEQTEVHSQLVDEKPISPNAIVVAPAAPTIKPVPKAAVDEDILKQAEAVIAGSGAARAAKEDGSKKGARRRIPGNVSFIENDPTLVNEAMAGLNQTSKYLLENPSLTLVLQSQLSAQEPKSLTQARFDSLKAYLTGKGVPDDQIMLDIEQKRGKVPEFLLFVIEH